jgi:3-dehydroquinate synthetase/predicted NBD/HSP70 family sugar kinase
MNPSSGAAAALNPAPRPRPLANVPAGQSAIVFDIGGTWFRSGVLTAAGELRGVTRRPAFSVRNYPHLSFPELQDALVGYLLSEAARLRRQFPALALESAGVSLGAALNAHSGVVLASGPLWGGESRPFDLTGELRVRDPETEWYVVNDVSAALLSYVADAPGDPARKLTLVTVSSGIACRTYDRSRETIPVDRVHGLQGEIGHVPVPFDFRGTPLRLRCDCGGMDHLGAFSSGRGIESLLGRLAELRPEGWSGSLLGTAEGGAAPGFPAFAAAVEAGDALALEVLDAATQPLARLLVHLLTFEPEVERIVLAGGVVESLGERYRESLLQNMQAVGMYLISEGEPGYFGARVRLGCREGMSGLRGAGVHALERRSRERVYLGAQAWTVRGSQEIRYTVAESAGLLDPANPALLFAGVPAGDPPPARRYIVIDAGADAHHGARIRAYFDHHGVEYHAEVLETSEAEKTFEMVARVAAGMGEFGVARRSEPVLAIGGGVVLDIVGLAANLYRRGVPYVRVPTTLLALVDAAVGVKTGVNFLGKKNRLGTYYPPSLALLDRAFLATLDTRHVCNGLAEILKIALVKDRALFALLEANAEALVRGRLQGGEVADEVIRRAIEGMVRDLEPNLWEQVMERLVDFGHTFSPAVEMHALPGLLHGEAVAVDMAFCAVLSYGRSLLSAADRDRVLAVTRRLQLPVTDALCAPGFLWDALAETTRHRGGLQRLPLPAGIGAAVFVNDLTRAEVDAAARTLDALLARAPR